VAVHRDQIVKRERTPTRCNNLHLIVASCWFSLSLHNSLFVSRISTEIWRQSGWTSQTWCVMLRPKWLYRRLWNLIKEARCVYNQSPTYIIPFIYVIGFIGKLPNSWPRRMKSARELNCSPWPVIQSTELHIKNVTYVQKILSFQK